MSSKYVRVLGGAMPLCHLILLLACTQLMHSCGSFHRPGGPFSGQETLKAPKDSKSKEESKVPKKQKPVTVITGSDRCMSRDDPPVEIEMKYCHSGERLAEDPLLRQCTHNKIIEFVRTRSIFRIYAIPGKGQNIFSVQMGPVCSNLLDIDLRMWGGTIEGVVQCDIELNDARLGAFGNKSGTCIVPPSAGSAREWKFNVTLCLPPKKAISNTVEAKFSNRSEDEGKKENWDCEVYSHTDKGTRASRSENMTDANTAIEECTSICETRATKIKYVANGTFGTGPNVEWDRDLIDVFSGSGIERASTVEFAKKGKRAICELETLRWGANSDFERQCVDLGTPEGPWLKKCPALEEQLALCVQ